YDSGGFLLFLRQGKLFAQAFELGRFEVHGDLFPIADNVTFDPVVYSSGFTSANHVIAFRTGSPFGLRRLVWYDRSGKEIGSLYGPDPGGVNGPELSPDEKHVVVNRTVSGNADVWVIDAIRGLSDKFTTDPAPDTFATWSPDGQWIAFASARKGPYD